MNKGTCGNCRFWKAFILNDNIPSSVGSCSCTKLINCEDGYYNIPIDGLGYQDKDSELFTGSDFGCIHYKSKTMKTIQHTAETCPGKPCSSECDHVEFIK